MKSLHKIIYYDRYARNIREEIVHANRLLNFLYNTNAGLIFTELILKHKFISQIYGLYKRSILSKSSIRKFVSNMRISEESIEYSSFENFNDFFIRKPDLSKRPIVEDSSACIAPADGKVIAISKLEDSLSFVIKKHAFNLETFLNDRALSNRFQNGSMIICRLCMADNHHFFYPDSGIHQSTSTTPGYYYAGGPYSNKKRIPFYSSNYRMMTRFSSDHFGDMLISEVGAFTVGSIRQDNLVNERVCKGRHKGWFELGGSTVVLLFLEGRIKFDDDIINNSGFGIETYIRMGDSVGRST
jgi:phosphatidylserine decarboxylase